MLQCPDDNSNKITNNMPPKRTSSKAELDDENPAPRQKSRSERLTEVGRRVFPIPKAPRQPTFFTDEEDKVRAAAKTGGGFASLENLDYYEDVRTGPGRFRRLRYKDMPNPGQGASANQPRFPYQQYDISPLDLGRDKQRPADAQLEQRAPAAPRPPAARARVSAPAPKAGPMGQRPRRWRTPKSAQPKR